MFCGVKIFHPHYHVKQLDVRYFTLLSVVSVMKGYAIRHALASSHTCEGYAVTAYPLSLTLLALLHVRY